VTLELSDHETRNLTPEELRLELACALYARGRLRAVGGAHLASVDLFSFQGALKERGIPRKYTMQDLHDDMEAMKTLFPE